MSTRRNVVRVEWVDSTRNGGWHQSENAKKNRTLCCSSVGWIVDENDDQVTVASHYYWDTDDVCDTMTIPRCAVTKIQRLGHELAGPLPKPRTKRKR